jgi:hypothetical protein
VRRTATWVLVGAVAALGVAALADALRGEPERVRAQVEPAAVPGLADEAGEAVRQLREAGVAGVLTYSDDECRLHAVSLPELEPVRAPSFEMCRPATAAGALGVVDGEVVWAGLGFGAIQVVLSREELSRAVRSGWDAPWPAPAGLRAVQAVALDDERYVVIADSPANRVAAVIADDRAVFVHSRSSASLVRPSPAGRYYALLEPGRFVLPFTRDGRTVEPPPGLPDAAAIAWSPDDRWTALATERSVYVFPTERPQELVIRIPLTVRDLDWSETAVAASP